jgi:hypothetical protein
MSLAVHIAHAVKLRGKDTGGTDGTEDEQIKDKDKLIDNGNARHRRGGDLSDHDIIQQIHQIGDTVLYDHGDGNGKHRAVKLLIPDIAGKETFSQNDAPRLCLGNIRFIISQNRENHKGHRYFLEEFMLR